MHGACVHVVSHLRHLRDDWQRARVDGQVLEGRAEVRLVLLVQRDPGLPGAQTDTMFNRRLLYSQVRHSREEASWVLIPSAHADRAALQYDRKAWQCFDGY